MLPMDVSTLKLCDFQYTTSIVVTLDQPKDPNSRLIKSWMVLLASWVNTVLEEGAKLSSPCGSSLASTVRTASYPCSSRTAAPGPEIPNKKSMTQEQNERCESYYTQQKC